MYTPFFFHLMPKKFVPKKIMGKPLTARQAELIRREFDNLKSEGKQPKNRSFKDWFKQHEFYLNMAWNEDIQEIVSHDTNEIIHDARKADITKVNGRKVDFDTFENRIDYVESFLITEFDGIENVRHQPFYTYEKNVIGIKLPTVKELKKIEKMNIKQAMEYLKEQFGIRIKYYDIITGEFLMNY